MVSYGGGANSTALLIGLHQHRIPVDLILFADTGVLFDYVRVECHCHSVIASHICRALTQNAGAHPLVGEQSVVLNGAEIHDFVLLVLLFLQVSVGHVQGLIVYVSRWPAFYCDPTSVGDWVYGFRLHAVFHPYGNLWAIQGIVIDALQPLIPPFGCFAQIIHCRLWHSVVLEYVRPRSDDGLSWNGQTFH